MSNDKTAAQIYHERVQDSRGQAKPWEDVPLLVQHRCAAYIEGLLKHLTPEQIEERGEAWDNVINSQLEQGRFWGGTNCKVPRDDQVRDMAERMDARRVEQGQPSNMELALEQAETLLSKAENLDPMPPEPTAYELVRKAAEKDPTDPLTHNPEWYPLSSAMTFTSPLTQLIEDREHYSEATWMEMAVNNLLYAQQHWRREYLDIRGRYYRLVQQARRAQKILNPQDYTSLGNAWDEKMDEQDTLLTTRQACETLQICRRTLSRWVEQGKLERVMFGSNIRYRLKDVLAMGVSK